MNFQYSMKAIISNFRMSRHRTKGNQMVVEIEGVENKEEAGKLVGKKVTWTSPANNEITGEIASAHGNSGAVRVRFEKGMPGQAIGNSVKIE